MIFHSYVSLPGRVNKGWFVSHFPSKHYGDLLYLARRVTTWRHFTRGCCTSIYVGFMIIVGLQPTFTITRSPINSTSLEFSFQWTQLNPIEPQGKSRFFHLNPIETTRKIGIPTAQHGAAQLQVAPESQILLRITGGFEYETLGISWDIILISGWWF